MTAGLAMIELKNLEADSRFSECLYDLKEIVDSEREIAALLLKVDELVGRDPAETAKHLTFLRIEIYSHLLKHIQKVRLPLAQLTNSLYASLGEGEPPEVDEPPGE